MYSGKPSGNQNHHIGGRCGSPVTELQLLDYFYKVFEISQQSVFRVLSYFYNGHSDDSKGWILIYQPNPDRLYGTDY